MIKKDIFFWYKRVLDRLKQIYSKNPQKIYWIFFRHVSKFKVSGVIDSTYSEGSQEEIQSFVTKNETEVINVNTPFFM